MYILINIDEIGKEYNTDQQFVDAVKLIAAENDDSHIVIDCADSAIQYIGDYCPDMTLFTK